MFTIQIIAMKHETEIYDGEPLNFETVVNRYLKFANQTSTVQTVQRPVIMKAFEHIKVRIFGEIFLDKYQS